MRRFVAGALFGSVGALIAVSPLGRISGAHIDPAVTLAFWLERGAGRGVRRRRPLQR
jgi:aquaporin Z